MSASSPTSTRVASILEAACRVVVRNGAHGLRIASVAHEAGVSKALVHYYFSTRQELMQSALAWSAQQWQDALVDEIAELPTAADRVERILLMSLDAEQPFSDQRTLWNEVWSSLRFDDKLRPLVDSFYREWIERLSGLIDEGRRDGSIPRAVEAVPTAWRLAAVSDGLDSMLYLGLLEREKARELLHDAVRRELASPFATEGA